MHSNTTQTLHAVSFEDTYGIAVGASGVVLTTVGGFLWTREESGTRNGLYGASASNASTVAGNYGTILKRASIIDAVADHDAASPTPPRIYPNPASDFITIPYSVARGGRVLIDVCDALGNVEAVVVDDVIDAGDYEAPLQTLTLLPGVYFVRVRSQGTLVAQSFVVTR
ncbi:MAG: T9SS type A sorting domain-containing protein [bacterium]|nr:T9SS type A sorting domain-containing protein [bacterium]